MKPLSFLGSPLDDLRAFPESARREAGYELDRVRRGLDPEDWKPSPVWEAAFARCGYATDQAPSE